MEMQFNARWCCYCHSNLSLFLSLIYSRGILPMNRGVLGATQMATSQMGNNILGTRPGLPSPTRGISPKDMFNAKQVGNRNLNSTISRCGRLCFFLVFCYFSWSKM